MRQRCGRSRHRSRTAIELTERYCVVMQTLVGGTAVTTQLDPARLRDDLDDLVDPSL